MRKSDKKVSSKYLVLGIIFIVTMVLTFLSMSFESVTPSATTMSAATIPVITMQSEEGNEFNSLHGFTQEINQALINDNLTPVAKTRQLPIIIHNYGAEVQELTYKIRNLSDNGLIENTKVTELVNNGETITATLNIKNLIDDNTQYALEIILETSTHEEIHYYTRIITGEDYSIDDKFAFVEDFNACTFNQDRLSEIQKYIETSSAGNNNNFGKVNINSTLSQIGWGDMGPYVESQLIPVIKEISKDVAVITFDYKIGAINEYESYDSYNVYEYYRIRQTTSGFYLLIMKEKLTRYLTVRTTSYQQLRLILEYSQEQQLNLILTRRELIHTLSMKVLCGATILILICIQEYSHLTPMKQMA